jgi:hypothetical protein
LFLPASADGVAELVFALFLPAFTTATLEGVSLLFFVTGFGVSSTSESESGNQHLVLF